MQTQKEIFGLVFGNRNPNMNIRQTLACGLPNIDTIYNFIAGFDQQLL